TSAPRSRTRSTAGSAARCPRKAPRPPSWARAGGRGRPRWGRARRAGARPRSRSWTRGGGGPAPRTRGPATRAPSARPGAAGGGVERERGGEREKIDAVGTLLTQVSSALFITGPGLSLESGLSHYRGIPGLVRRTAQDARMIEAALAIDTLHTRPKLTWRT